MNNLFAGNYQVQIADANACELVLNFRVNEPEILVIAEIVSTLVSCPEGSNGTLEAFVTGGTLRMFILGKIILPLFLWLKVFQKEFMK